MYCPICDNPLSADEPEENIIREHCTVCSFVRETEVPDAYWV